MTLFQEIIKVSLGTSNQLSRTPSSAEWVSLYNESQKQAIVGVILYGLERLPEAQRPSQNLLLQWIGSVQMVEASYVLQCERAKELTKLFSDAGYSSSVLKGLGFSKFYPVPARRQGGDIDLWVDGKRESVMKWLRDNYVVERVVWHHADAKIFDDVETEIHFHPGWLYNPIKNRKLQEWFNGQKGVQMKVLRELGFAYPDVSFNAVYSLIHLYHHLIEEGIGIRHIIDYYYILKALPTQNREGVLKDLQRFGLFKLASAMMWVLLEVCGMPDEYLICVPCEREGRFLLEEIMRGGNFGKYRNDNLRRNTVARMLALLPHYPSEVLWAVPWKLWHKCWRWFNR